MARISSLHPVDVKSRHFLQRFTCRFAAIALDAMRIEMVIAKHPITQFK